MDLSVPEAALSELAPAEGHAPTFTLKSMRLDQNLRSGTTKGSIKRANEIVVSFYESGGVVSYGRDSSDLRTFDFRTTEAYGSEPDLYTGDKVATFDGGFDVEDNIIITGSSPVACTIRAIIVRSDITGR